MSDIDIYEDLSELSFGESISKIDEERQSYKKQLDEKEADLHQTKERISRLERENKILEKNISSLYRTAVSEIKRKDQLIEELRREKESLIFRRKNKQNPIIKSTQDAGLSGLDSNFQISGSPIKHGLSSVESTKAFPSSPVNSGKKKLLETTCNVESSSDVSLDYKSSVERLSNALISDSLREEKKGSCHRVNDISVKVAQTNAKITDINSLDKTCENNCSEIKNALHGKLFSDSSQTSPNVPHQSGSKEPTSGSKNAKQSSFSGERRERQRDDYSDKYYSRHRHRSSHNSYRSLKAPRNERSWDHNDDTKYSRDSYNKTDYEDQKPRTGGVEARQRHSWRRPSPPDHSRRYTDQRCSNSKVKTLSDNVRVAAQLKSKYSKTMRERSMSRTPVKQQRFFQEKTKFESSSKPVVIEPTVFSIGNLEDRFVSMGQIYGSKLRSREQPSEESVGVNLNNCVQSKENDSDILDKSCSINHDVTEHTSSAQSIRSNSEFYRSITESKVELTTNEDDASNKSPLQQIRTPPTKNLIPMKISPSFEDPAVVRGAKFSFSVFNEQCEFKRPKRKRSVKLLVSDIKDLSVSENSEKYNSETNSDYNCARDDAMKQNIGLCQQSNNGILEQSVSYEKNHTVNFKNQSKGMVHNNNTLEDKLQKTSESNKDLIHLSDIKILNTPKLPEVEVQSDQISNSPKKRKVDLICEELKADIEKKHDTNQLEFVSDGHTNTLPNADKQVNVCSSAVNVEEQSKTMDMNSNFSNTVSSNEQPKRIIIKSKRRKSFNLQNNRIKVISQVKSRLSS